MEVIYQTEYSLRSQVVPNGKWSYILKSDDDLCPGCKKDEKLKEPKREETQDEDGISVRFMDEVAVVPGSYSKSSKMKKTIPLERLREQYNHRNAST
ncbi:hypothetical protein D5086_000529 [Populus alba]|uniref:Uncharacterized protein n=1 Tax=Populus alba TaxID=43335 RepID=A0ACC4CWM8_POPAL